MRERPIDLLSSRDWIRELWLSKLQLAGHGGKPADAADRSASGNIAKLSDARGFSLIEVIAALVIVGVLAAIASMGIVTGTKGYLQTKENTHLTQKAQTAMMRIQRELTELSDVIVLDNSTPALIFDNPAGRQGIQFSNGTVLLHELGPGANTFGADTGRILVDQVAGLTLTYYNGDTPGWLTADGIRYLSAIDVNLTLHRKENPGEELPFSNLVHPRNNDNYGGAPTDYAAYSAPRYECFVSSAGQAAGHSGVFWALVFLAAAWMPAASVGRRSRRGGNRNVRCREGNVLVGLVVVMLVFSALGAGMVSMTSTTTTEQITTNSSVRAYYLAESGFRYAASRYLNAVDTDNRYGPWDERNVELTNLHGKTYRLRDNAGEFHLSAYPSFLAADESVLIGATSLRVRVPGGIPEGSSIPIEGANARIKIDNRTYTYNFYDEVNREFLNISGGLLEEVETDAAVMIVGLSAGTSQILSQGGSLVLKDGRFFPRNNGRVRIFGDVYQYVSRNDDFTLSYVTRADNPATSFSLSLSSNTEVILEPSITLRSVGDFGTGDFKAVRTIHYDVPLPVNLWDANPIPGQKIALKIPMNLAHFTPERAAFATVQRAGQEAIEVTAYDSSGPLGPKSAELAFDWTTTQANFASAHRTAGRYLSYDAQMKMGFDPEPFPTNSWGPEGSPVPQHYMAGISFRMNGSGSMLGLAFQRGANGSTGPDNITSELVPVDDVNTVVLWQENAGDTSDPNWLAYAETGLLFADGAELSASIDQWTADSPWTRGTNFKHRGTWSWTTSPSGEGSYTDPPSGTVWNDSLTSGTIDLSHATSAKITFWTRYRIVSCQDYGYVEISTDGGSTWVKLNNRISQHCGGSEPDLSSYAHYTSNSTDYTANWGDFLKKEIDISTYAGSSDVRIRFRFNRNPSSTRNGWWIDDVRVIQNFDVQDATLLLRLQETKAVPFTGGSTAIAVGDRVLQDNGAAGTVVVQPVLDSGTWAGGDAAGVLWLNLTSEVNYSSGSALKIGTTTVAAAASSSAAGVGINVRYNLIKAFYGSVAGIDPPPTVDIDIDDQERLQNPIGATPGWPPDEGTTLNGSSDFFTLVEWNDTFDSVSALRLRDENGRYSIIAVDDSLFYTPVNDIFPFTRPELGLHAAGHGTENVYFQDLAIQLTVASDEGFDVVQR